jgi:hypothetical protein
VATRTPDDVTKIRRFFSEPSSPRQRQYEALRAYFFEQSPSAEVAKRFGYSTGAFRVLCHTFPRDELPDFFAVGRPGPRTQPKKCAAVEKIVELRKRNYSIYEISQELKAQGTPLSATAVGEVLAAEDLPASRAVAMTSGPHASAQPSRLSPMRASFRLPRASLRRALGACSYSSPTSFASILRHWPNAPSCPRHHDQLTCWAFDGAGSDLFDDWSRRTHASDMCGSL